METSRTAIFNQSGEPIKLQQISVPTLQPGEILVRNTYVTLCRSDLNTFCGKRIEPTPTILGHEIVGTIAAFGSTGEFTDLRGAALTVGDRISWAIFASDPHSALALQGIPQKGDHLFKYGHQKLTEQSTLHGGLSQYIILKPHTPIVKLADSLPDKVAAIINCAVATVAGALRLAGTVHQKQVLVSGAGMLGAVACAMAKTAGASAVVAFDVNAARLEQAKQYGADYTLQANADIATQLQALPLPKRGIDVVLEMSGVTDAMEQTIGMLGIGGVAVWVGATYPERKVQVNAELLVRNLITLKGLHNYNATDFMNAVLFMEAHHLNFPFADMVYDGFNLQQVNEAFAYGIQNNPFRVGIQIL